jgi:hypothetical protein
MPSSHGLFFDLTQPSPAFASLLYESRIEGNEVLLYVAISAKGSSTPPFSSVYETWVGLRVRYTGIRAPDPAVEVTGIPCDQVVLAAKPINEYRPPDEVITLRP